MRALLIALSALTIGVAGCAAGSARPPVSPASTHIAAALADTTRPAAERERDAVRRPAEILAFAGVQPGDRVADFIMGGGYFTRLLASAVGPQGRVYAYQPAEFIAFQASYGEQQRTTVAALPNATALNMSLRELAFSEPLDLVFTAQNYHDLHLRQMPAGLAAQVNRTVFEALKPGGVFLVIDHHAAAGSGTSAADTLHRIDREAVIREVTAAGFVLDGELDILRAPADPRTASVFDPSIRGRTDQFVLRFRKPAR